MKALSLTQPWAWIMLNLGKRIENRSRNIGNYRGPVLLHAALRCTTQDWVDALEFVRSRFGQAAAERIPLSVQLMRGAIVGRAIIADQCRPGFEGRSLERAADWSALSDWYMGAHAYLIDDILPTPVVKCKGALGFWNVPESVLEELRRKEAA